MLFDIDHFKKINDSHSLQNVASHRPHRDQAPQLGPGMSELCVRMSKGNRYSQGVLVTAAPQFFSFARLRPEFERVCISAYLWARQNERRLPQSGYHPCGRDSSSGSLPKLSFLVFRRLRRLFLTGSSEISTKRPTYPRRTRHSSCSTHWRTRTCMSPYRREPCSCNRPSDRMI